LITGKERDVVIGDLGDPFQQQIGASLGAFPDHKRHDQSPNRRKGDPNPGIAVGLTDEFGGQEILLFGMHKAPQLIQLAFSQRQVLPQREHDQPAMQRRAVQPRTGCIFVDLDNPPGRAQRIAFRQRTDGSFEKLWWSIEFKIGGAGVQGDAPSTGAAQSLFF